MYQFIQYLAISMQMHGATALYLTLIDSRHLTYLCIDCIYIYTVSAPEECYVCKLPYKFILSMGSARQKHTPNRRTATTRKRNCPYKQYILYYKSTVVCMYFSNGFRGAVVFRNVSKSQTKMSTTRRDMQEAEIFAYKFQF